MKKIELGIFYVPTIALLSTAAVLLGMRFIGAIPLSLTQSVAQRPTTFSVSGTSEKVAIPDEAEVSLGIQISENSVERAQQRANEVSTAVRDAMLELGINKDDIRTENYSIYPQYDYSSSDVNRIVGYSVNSTFLIRTNEMDKINQVIDRGTTAGANQVSGVSFRLSDDLRAKVEKEARAEAIEKAKDKAKELSGLAGIRLGRVVDVVEGGGGDFNPVPMLAERAIMPDAAGGKIDSVIEPGSTKFNFTVTLSYETL